MSLLQKVYIIYTAAKTITSLFRVYIDVGSQRPFPEPRGCHTRRYSTGRTEENYNIILVHRMQNTLFCLSLLFFLLE